jgi:hypothetical protein
MSYCTKEEVNSLFGDISDEITDEMFTTVIDNSTSWIDSNLRKAYVPIPEIETEIVETETEDSEDTEDPTNTTEYTSQHNTTIGYNLINVPSGLRTAAIYYAASDVLLSLYHGDDLPTTYDVWFNKAQSLLDDYIEAYLNSEAEEEDLLSHQMVGHSHSQTYSQKRGRQRWVR